MAKEKLEQLLKDLEAFGAPQGKEDQFKKCISDLKELVDGQDGESGILGRLDKLEEKELELPVAEVESEVSEVSKVESPASKPDGARVRLRARLKGQKPDSKCLLEFESGKELVETIHEAKKRNGTVWVRFKLRKKGTLSQLLVDPELVVRDQLE